MIDCTCKVLVVETFSYGIQMASILNSIYKTALIVDCYTLNIAWNLSSHSFFGEDPR